MTSYILRWPLSSTSHLQVTAPPPFDIGLLLNVDVDVDAPLASSHPLEERRHQHTDVPDSPSAHRIRLGTAHAVQKCQTCLSRPPS